MSKLIPLTQGYSAIVDDDDYDYLIQWKWCAVKNKRMFYAARNLYWNLNGNERGRVLLMHRELIGVSGLMVDHINRDSLDNRRQNLRLVTNSQNQMNRQSRLGASKYKGVHWNKDNMAWKSQIRVGGKKMYLGYFHNEKEAAIAYDCMAIKHFGKFARTNFPYKNEPNNPNNQNPTQGV